MEANFIEFPGRVHVTELVHVIELVHVTELDGATARIA